MCIVAEGRVVNLLFMSLYIYPWRISDTFHFSWPSIEKHHMDYWPAAHLNIVSHLGSIQQQIGEKHTKNLCWMEIKIWIVKKTLIVLLKAMAYLTKEKTRVRKIWNLKLHPRLAKTKFTLCFSLMSLKWPNWNRNELNPTNQKTKTSCVLFLGVPQEETIMSHHFINVITAAFGYCTKTEPDAVSQCFSPISFHSSVWMRINKP